MSGSHPIRPAAFKQTLGYVYLLGSENGCYKIGKSIRPNKRVTELTIQLPFQVEILHLLPCEDYTNAERAFHMLFHRWHINGEWYQLPTSAVVFFCGLKGIWEDDLSCEILERSDIMVKMWHFAYLRDDEYLALYGPPAASLEESYSLP